MTNWALTKYTDRKTRDAITEKVALLTTQGRALGFTVRGYVQEPTEDTVPVRELFPRRVCLRVSAKSHVGMVLGEQAFERGAWANRIGESEAGVGYVVGEGIREPLRIRAGWVPDETIKQLETFVTGPVTHDTAVLPFPTKPTDPDRVDPGEVLREHHHLNQRCGLRGGGATARRAPGRPRPAGTGIADSDDQGPTVGGHRPAGLAECANGRGGAVGLG